MIVERMPLADMLERVFRSTPALQNRMSAGKRADFPFARPSQAGGPAPARLVPDLDLAQRKGVSSIFILVRVGLAFVEREAE